MGLRGIGASPRSGKGKAAASFRDVLPWEAKGLSRAERVIAFCEDLPVTQGSLAGTNAKLRPWQRKFVRAVYRTDRKGNRPVRTAVLSMARKNGKSFLASALALCHLVGPEAEPRGEVYSAANDRAQAARIFHELVAMLNGHPELGDRCNIIRFTKTIEVLEGVGKGSTFIALSADATTKMGLNISFAIYDELGQAPKRALYEALDTAMGGRENPLLMVISTQAADDTAILSELIDYGLKIESGEIEDPSFHLTLFAAPEDANPWAPVTWKLANPALGDFRSLEDIERQARQAQRVPSKENAFRNLLCNMRVASHTRFIARAEWEACSATPDLAALAGRECYAGLDLSAGRDLTALVLVFPDGPGFEVLCRFYLPENGLAEKAESDRVPYDVWAKQGHLTLIPGATIDPSFVAEDMAQLAADFDIRAVAYDRWRIEDLRRELNAIGSSLTLTEHGQGFKDMAPAVDMLERVVADRRIRHGSNPVLNMCAANCIVELDAAGNRKLSKAKSAGRIDGIVALAMALTAASRFEAAPLPACLLELAG